MKRTQFVHSYILGIQRRIVESAEPDTKLPSLDTVDVIARTSESCTLTQHRSLKSAIVLPTLFTNDCGKTGVQWPLGENQ